MTMPAKTALAAIAIAASLSCATTAQAPASDMRTPASDMRSGTADLAPPTSAGVVAMRDVWKMMTDNVIAAAEEMPDADYAYKPTPNVRTFGQLVAHIAGAQRLMCASALGEKAGNEDDIEKTMTTKAQLVPALKESTAYCARAYAQSDASAAAMTSMFGQQGTRFFALSLNAAHNGEHYGNIVTYFRMKGMVPPSSRPRS